jgi:hypothetical protein
MWVFFIALLTAAVSNIFLLLVFLLILRQGFPKTHIIYVEYKRMLQIKLFIAYSLKAKA